ncbi:hypothetical protein [Nonomuraea sp. NPDC046570]|uniref:hypothetical protein n=1 Tax=Nonomuraea sp. NPDC046570 TaxID=3155255 RepID=UPI0033FBBB15
MFQIVGVIVIIQGLMGFAGKVFFDKEWGLLHRWFDLSPIAYLGIAVVGLVLVVVGEARKD